MWIIIVKRPSKGGTERSNKRKQQRNSETLVQYKKAQATVRKTVKNSKARAPEVLWQYWERDSMGRGLGDDRENEWKQKQM